MDDLQTLVERNLSGREAEARRVEGILRSELARFERWLSAQEVTPTITALHARADEVVRRVLDENEPRWEGLTEADRERLAVAARAIASRLLHEPTCSSSAKPRTTAPTRRSRCCASSSASTGQRAARGARGRGLRPARAPAPPRQVSRLRLGSRGSALAQIQAQWVAEALDGAEVVTVRTADADVGDPEQVEPRAPRLERAVPNQVSSRRSRPRFGLEADRIVPSVTILITPLSVCATNLGQGANQRFGECHDPATCRRVGAHEEESGTGYGFDSHCAAPVTYRSSRRTIGGQGPKVPTGDRHRRGPPGGREGRRAPARLPYPRFQALTSTGM